MSDPEEPSGPTPGPLVAAGRAADVFDLGDGTVLRRYRSHHDSSTEGRLMTWLQTQGIRVPTVHRAGGRDLVMERVDGPTMLDDLGRRPWMVVRHARTLADLQRRINDLPAPEWLPLDPTVGDGDTVVHGDLHPDNVLLGPKGPVVIDFSNSCRGPADFDAALTHLLMSTFAVDGAVDRIGQRVIVRAFSRRRGLDTIRTGMAAAIAYRLADANVTDAERHRIEEVRRAAT